MQQPPDPHVRRSGWDDTTDPLPQRVPSDGQAMPPLPHAGAGYGSRPRAAYAPVPGPAPLPGPAPIPTPRAPAAPRRTWPRVVRWVLLVLVVAGIVGGGLTAHRLYDFGSAISSQPPLTTQTGFVSGLGRVNLLVMGYGGAGHDGAYLTDSMMVISLVPSDGATTMISVPRDLWVQVPPDSGQYAKLNAAYADGLANGYDGLPAGKMAGGAEAARKVSDVIGIPVTYWMTIDFTGFRGLVDALGGVDVNVPTAFTANYPRNDNAQIDAGWKTIHFAKGPQHMDGERAIEYARARYVLSPASEGSDFARSVRQQLLIRAIVSRAREPSAWPGLSGAADALQTALYTNLSLTDLGLVAQKMDYTNAARVGLSDANVLVDGHTGDGQAILQPANGDWQAIQRYVAKNLKD